MLRLLLLSVQMIELFLLSGSGQVDVNRMNQLSLNVDKIMFFDTLSPVPTLKSELRDIAGVTVSHFFTRDPESSFEISRVSMSRRYLNNGRCSLREGHLLASAGTTISISGISSRQRATARRSTGSTSRSSRHAGSSSRERLKLEWLGGGSGSHCGGGFSRPSLGRSHERRNSQGDRNHS